MTTCKYRVDQRCRSVQRMVALFCLVSAGSSVAQRAAIAIVGNIIQGTSDQLNLDLGGLE